MHPILQLCFPAEISELFAREEKSGLAQGQPLPRIIDLSYLELPSPSEVSKLLETGIPLYTKMGWATEAIHPH